jgi:hypothetical protein
MNRHFEDAAYYLKRAGETATAGVRETVAHRSNGECGR